MSADRPSWQQVVLMLNTFRQFEDHWTQEHWADGETGSLHLMGALWCARRSGSSDYARWQWTSTSPDIRADLIRDPVTALTLALLITAITGGNPTTALFTPAAVLFDAVVAWHDQPGRTEDEVADLLLAAAGEVVPA